jgi:ankyrin repeat protein
LTGAEERRDVLRRFIIANTARCLAQPGVDVDARDDDGNRPLHWAARQEFSDAVQMLLDAGADPNPQSHNGTTPLYVAAGNTSAAGVTIVHVLLAAGADPTVRMVNGSSAVRLARRRGAQRVLDAFAGYGYS